MGFTPNKKNANDFNGGVQYKNGDSLQAESLNHIIEGLLYAQENGNGGGSGETGADGRMGAIQLLLEYDGENGFGYHLYVLKCLDPTVQEEDFDGMVGLVGLVVKKTSNDVDNNLSIGDIVSITGVKDRHLVCNTDDGGEVFGNIRGEKGDKGDTGADGKTPVKGVDYFTEADKAEIAAQAAAKVDLSDYAKTSDISSHNTSTSAHADIREEISQLSSEIVDLPNNELLVQNVAQKVPYVKVAESPTFVDSVDEMTDISKMYVLKSDGMFYSYKAHTTTTPGETTPNFTNLVPTSIDTDGSIYNGVGYKEDVRLSSSGGISSTAQVGSVTTGFIPYTPGAFIRIKGAEIIGARDKYNGFYYINFYDANKALKLHIPDFSLENHTAVTTPSYDESTGAEVIDTSRCIGNDSSSARDMRASSYFRITAYGKGADLIVTVNEEITYTTVEGGTNTTYSWESTGISYNQPADYEDRVIAMENELEVLLNGTF